jgi:hypothetical protein
MSADESPSVNPPVSGPAAAPAVAQPERVGIEEFL